MNDGDLLIKITSPTISSGTAPAQSRTLAGWTNIRVTRGVERIPNDFSISMTESFPGQAQDFVVQKGDQCRVYIGDDVVLTGYIDRFSPSISKGSHSITLTGRGLCQDLVDCSAEWDGGQISGTNALDVAKKLAKPYNIEVNTDIAQTAPIPQFNISYTDTPWDTIERICRYSAFLAYELADGSLFITQVGQNKHSSNLVEGQNIQDATATFDASQLFSEYRGYLVAIETWGDLGKGGLIQTSVDNPVPVRHRVKSIIAESVGGTVSADIVKARVSWELNRRNARSRSATVVVDSWRDSAGALWQPNYLIDLVSPNLKINTVSDGEPWVIGEVTYSRQEGSGTLATLSVMPASAYKPQPQRLQPDYPDIPFTNTNPPT